jgi:hypothetical protein
VRVALVMVVALGVARAHADAPPPAPPSADDLAKAAELAKLAVDAMSDGTRYDAAAALFQQAFDVSQKLEYLLDVGVAYRMGGRGQAAVTAFRRYLDLAGPSIAPALRAQIDGDIASLVAASGQAHVTTAGADATIALDGRPVGTASRASPLVVLVPVGPDHALTASRPGDDDAVRALAMRAGESIDVELEPTPRPTTVPITIVTIPSGASLMLGTTALGTAPQRRELAPGAYEITAALPDYRIAHDRVVAILREPQDVTIRLEHNPTWWERNRVLALIGGGAAFVAASVAVGLYVHDASRPPGDIRYYP